MKDKQLIDKDKALFTKFELDTYGKNMFEQGIEKGRQDSRKEFATRLKFNLNTKCYKTKKDINNDILPYPKG